MYLERIVRLANKVVKAMPHLVVLGKFSVEGETKKSSEGVQF